MEGRKQFTFYRSFYEALSRIKGKADRADAFDAICQFALYGEEPDLDTLSDAGSIAFLLIRPVLETAEAKAKSGKKGGETKHSQSTAKAKASKPKANRKQTGSKAKQSATDKEGEVEIEGEVEKEVEKESLYTPPTPLAGGRPPEGAVQKRKTFKPPTLDEVRAYCTERGNTVNPEQWFDHYTSNGWKVGKNTMKDWKAAVRTWERSEYRNTTTQKKASSGPAPAAQLTPEQEAAQAKALEENQRQLKQLLEKVGGAN